MSPRVTAADTIEVGGHRFVAEASTLGLPPGTFPDRLDTTLGNEMPLLRVGPTEDGAGVRYRQAAGIVELLVLND